MIKNKFKTNKNTCKMINESNFSISLSDRSHLKGGSALDMRERRLGLGWNAVRRGFWCEESLIRADNLFTKSPPSIPPILSSEFLNANLRRVR
jgi:hypothetical protein